MVDKKSILILIVSICVCFLILEIVVRMVWIDQRNDYPIQMFERDQTKGYVLTKNFTGNYVLNAYKDIQISINSKGIRDREFDYKKPTNTVRILVLGDSVTFGAGINVNETYEKLLEKDLKNTEIINAGVSGYDFYQEKTYYLEEGFKYNPDIVIIGVVLNDITPFDLKKVQDSWFEDSGKSLTKLIRDNCRSCKFIYSTINEIKTPRDKYNNLYFKQVYSMWENETIFNNYKSELKELKNNLTRENKKLVLVIFPYTEQFKYLGSEGDIPQQKLLNLSKEMGITAINLLPDLDFNNSLQYYFPKDNIHLTAEGNKFIKSILYKKLIQKGIIKNE